MTPRCGAHVRCDCGEPGARPGAARPGNKPVIVADHLFQPRGGVAHVKHPFQNAEFAGTAADDSQLPSAQAPEIAFAGRSNAGKSSAINALANRTRLAFTSKTPGRT